MRAVRLFALFFALNLAGLLLAGAVGLSPVAPGYAEPSQADPQSGAKGGQAAAAKSSPDPKAAPVSGEHKLPAFVPGNGLLTQAADGSSDAEGGGAGTEPDSPDSNAASKDAGPAPENSTARTITITTEPIAGTSTSITASLKAGGAAPKWPEFVEKAFWRREKTCASGRARDRLLFARLFVGSKLCRSTGQLGKRCGCSNWGHPQLISLIEILRRRTEAGRLAGAFGW